MKMGDTFNRLDDLKLSPELLALNPPKQGRKPARRRTLGKFYHVPEAWFDRAAAALGSKEQLVIAIRLYRLWKTRGPDSDFVVASNVALAGPGFSREIKRRTLNQLWAAKLIDVRSGGNGRAPRVTVLE